MHTFKGKTAKFYIPGVRYVHGPVRGRYRIMWPEYRSRYLETIQSGKLKPKEESELTAKCVADLLSEWDAVYSDDHPDAEKRGKPMPISAEVLLTECYQQSYYMLQRVVLGFGESLPDPEDGINEQLRAAERQQMSPKDLFEELQKEDDEQVGNSGEGCG
ncbi:MAG: hypothetical protein E6Q97_30100 [Desulfurellales bacterium]|nr:MAG: hypothetical protein E6Q97_30100 [Desulfurellales bacterium]